MERVHSEEKDEMSSGADAHEVFHVVDDNDQMIRWDIKIEQF